jgi:hypothetical protein
VRAKTDTFARRKADRLDVSSPVSAARTSSTPNVLNLTHFVESHLEVTIGDERFVIT